MTWLHFRNRNFKSLNLSFEFIIAGRLKCCGMEDRMVVAYGCRNTIKLLCGIEGTDVVAYGRLPSPARFVCVGSRLWVLMNARFDNIRIEEDSSIFIIVPYSQYIQYILYIYIHTEIYLGNIDIYHYLWFHIHVS